MQKYHGWMEEGLEMVRGCFIVMMTFKPVAKAWIDGGLKVRYVLEKVGCLLSSGTGAKWLANWASGK